MPDSPGFEATQGITLSYTSMQFHGLQYKLSSRDRNCIDQSTTSLGRPTVTGGYRRAPSKRLYQK
ncbi:hypothetical protein FRB94_005385 [Tulasnella sp. JGI-2019a]|nr:hypothetical protein FRB94_005385 [Tulasnella sp. JGI-2019a]